MAGGGGDVKLIGGWATPFAMRVRIALNLKGVPYEFIEEVYFSKSQLLLQSNPVFKRIPVLLHHGRSICESTLIVQYIDGIWAESGPAILPADPFDRVTAGFWTVYVDEKWFPHGLKGLLKANTDEEKSAAMVVINEGLHLLEKAFIECSKGGEFFNGETMGYLDLTVGCFLGWLRALEMINNIKLIKDTETPRLAKWAEIFCGHDAVKGILGDPRRLADFGDKLRAMWDAEHHSLTTTTLAN